MSDEEVTTKMALYNYNILKGNKCLKCKKKTPVVLIAQYIYSKDDINVAAYCKGCFRKEMPEYNLEDTCIVCRDNLDCSTQKLLFSRKEIRDFKEKYWGK